MKKILFLLIIHTACLASVTVLAKGKESKAVTDKHSAGLTIGYQRGRELLFNSTPLLHSHQSKVHYNVTNRLVLRKDITNNVSVETGITLSKPAQSFKDLLSNTPQKPFSVSLPVTLQYYFVPKKCKMRPYCGVGVVYDFTSVNYSLHGANTDGYGEQLPSKGTKYINLLVTQGVTYEVNTHIQINESIHFIPQENNKTLGLDVGVGYKF